MPLVRIGPEMPAFRARAFMRNGIRSPSDILEKGKSKILEILLDIIPFESDEPMKAKTRQASRNMQLISALGDGRDGNSSIDKKQWQKSCDRLADGIMRKAYSFLREEQTSHQTIHAMSLAITTTTNSSSSSFSDISACVRK